MILTLTELKTLLNIGDSSQDAKLNMIMPICESDIHTYTKNDFGMKTYNTTAITNDIIYCANTDLKANDTIIFTEGINKDEPMTILTRSATELTVDKDLEDETTANSFYKVKYPTGLKLIFSQMVNHKLNEVVGVKSESIGQYSVTYDISQTGYPQQIWNSLRKYSKYYKRSE